jgi:hypothetical protein
MNHERSIKAGQELFQATAKLVQMNAISLATNYGAAASASYILSLTDSLQDLSEKLLDFITKEYEEAEHDCENCPQAIKDLCQVAQKDSKG